MFSVVSLEWELGTAFTANGTLSDSNTNIRTNLIRCNAGSNFTADFGYYLIVMKYDPVTEIYIGTDVGWTNTYTTDDTYAIRVLAKTQNGDIISDVSSVSSHIHLYCVTDDRITALEREVENFESKTLRIYTQENLDVSKFTASADNSDWYWANDEAYPAGYIDHFVIYGTDESVGNTAYVAVYDKTLGKFVWHSEPVVATGKKVVIPCNAYFEHEIYVLPRLKYIAHNSAGNSVKYALMWEFGVWSEGAVFEINWKTTPVQFKFAVECWYNDYIDPNTLHYAKDKNKMFIAGDSITAGYPYTAGISRPNYYDPDIKWGEQLARRYGFDITYVAQTGSGWLYRSDPSAQYAISIADNNDFSNYDSAVFAFGTNDYGNNSPLGDIDDLYPGDNTVCGAINYVINKVYNDNPKITLIISTPINRSDVGTASSNYGYGAKNTANYTLLELVEKMKELCVSNGVCIIDNSNTPFNKYTLDNLLMDHLHPNTDGYKILGSFLSERISLFVTPYTRNVLTADD